MKRSVDNNIMGRWFFKKETSKTPLGMTLPDRSYNAHTYRHGFTGHEKESDLAEGIYTTEYRLYDARVGRWLSVDPLFEKYVGMSPYNYCAGNPVMMVDPDGKEVGVNVDGETFVYNPTIKENRYSGNNEIIGRFVSTLNKMNSTRIGNKLLKSLHESGNKYIITNQASSKSNTNATVKSKDGVINKMGVSCKLLDISHELFHSYQYEKGQGGASIFNEIEAYIFSNRLVNEYNDKIPYDSHFYENYTNNDNFMYSDDFINDRPLSQGAKEYEKAVKSLVYGDVFSSNDFNTAWKCFNAYSSKNGDGLYNTKHYKFKLPQNKFYLISSFYK